MLVNLGCYYLKDGDFAKSFKCFDKARNYYIRDPLSNCSSTTLLNLAILAALKCEFEQARELSY